MNDDTLPALPREATAMIDWPWSGFEPYYRELAGRTLTRATVSEFLSDWTRLNERIDEIYNRLYVGTTVNTADEAGERRFHKFLDEIYPGMQAEEQNLKNKLVASGLQVDDFELPLLKMKTEAEIYRVENLPLLVQEQKLNNEYDRINGKQTVAWEGKEVTTSQLRPVFQDTDRARREQAWRLAAKRQLEDRGAINELWRRFLKLRLELARNAGFADYRSYRWKQMLRFDYTSENCRQFHRAIEEVVVPAAGRIYERRRKRLGLNQLRPWDLDVDPLGRPALHPFQDGNELQSKVAEIFHRVDPQIGGYFNTMIREGLLDLENRKNKAPGAYCTAYWAIQRPFIFSNSVGTKEDVTTLLHEGGHAVHVFETVWLPYYQQRQVGFEFAEVASMSMELLSLPYTSIEQGGFYAKADLARVASEQLEKNVLFWPYMAVVDAFQHWVYENPQAADNPVNCDARWASLWQRFMPGVDWSGLDDEMMTGWHRKLHIHTMPFYYVEYGLAQLGATLVWGNALKDQAKAVAHYRRALALGGTRSLPELYAAAGARFTFEADGLREAIGLIERKLEEWQP
jgi:oligoendopeptidase F